ncbi:AfsR/SARP family transcriptional regulator [Nonomuraea sp. SBT364]|uniref:AfsR/SARP family transcriptional regulator n=1 Tax=Nonomuraea sp. SBT364 TaxID=1580530 RepID=UPI00066AC67B|nr:BTAD domain-containing putative transcriptional regulator [Nonomuraea sp. SBT364]
MALEISFLGPWQVLAAEEPVRFAGRRRIGVLARLALNAGQSVHAERLLTDIWGDSSAATAAKQLHIVISKLRETLGPHTSEEIIQTVSGSYRLALDPGHIDAHRFARLIRRARTAHAQGHAATADAHFRTALTLWRGEPLAGLAYPWAGIEATRLREEHRAALEDHADLRLAAGDHQALAADLAAHVRAHPLRERPAAQLMLALHRSGRPAEALAVYQDTRRIMVAELGIEPRAELRRLHQAILVKDPVLDLTTPAQQVGLGRPYVPAELPADTAAFTARATEIGRLRTALESTGGPAVTMIEGPGGIGKSALAVHVAHDMAARFTDGVLYVNLRGATDGLRPLTPIEALGQLLRSLGLDGSAVPATVDEASARYRSLTSARNVLIILDNALDTRQVRPLIPTGARCAVVITSRQSLTSLDGASRLNLPTLAPSDSAALLARIAGPGRVHAEPEAAGRIIRLCGGLPLALRIAAARLAARPDWTLSYLADRLADATRRLDTLEYADLAVRAGIAVSHRHLSEEPNGQDAAHVLSLLALLDTPTHTPAATAALAGWPEARAEAALERLHDARLLESAGRGRYRFHDLIRLYARELPTAGSAAALRRALHHYLATANAATGLVHLQPEEPAYAAEQPGVALADAREAGEWTEAERDNLLAVARQATDPGTAVALAIGLHWPFNYRGWVTQLADVHRNAAEMAGRCGDWAGQARVESFLGWIYRDQGRFEQAIDHLERAVECWDKTALPHRKMGPLNKLGVVHTVTGRLDLAVENLAQALDLAEKAGDRYGRGAVLNNRVHVLYRQGRFDEAIEQARAAIVEWDGVGIRYGDGVSRATLARAFMHAGRLTEAAGTYQVALTLMREAGYRAGYAVTAWWSAHTQHALGRHAEARQDWRNCFESLLESRLLTQEDVDGLLEQPVPDMPGPLRNML